MTGLDPVTNVIVEIATLITDDELKIIAADAFAEAQRRHPRRDLVPVRQEITIFGGKRHGNT